MLIGEFIRRHHARLAHEIAIKGFPGKPHILPFAEKLSEKIKSMIGLIARSHGMSLRKCIDHIELTYGKSIRVTPNNTHAGYLMILLRIADYIQIDNNRTSRAILKIKTFSSPISEMEHNAHLAINAIDDKYQNDPERIYIDADPLDSMMFLKIQKLVRDIQYEFDISWAVLGELYGNIKDKPQIKYRRLTSNLEDEKYILSQSYVPTKFTFKANDDITKLLMAPLYGDDPKFGIRELIQNAVDACREREVRDKKAGSVSTISAISVDIVEIDGVAYFIIRDNGVGMDIDVISNYFLSAGSSYRKSINWLKEFASPDGKINVRRNGRFGIGILAAFLIGDEIYVETKKNEKTYGYKFHADLNSEQINILKDDKISNGTSIKIKIDDKKLKLLQPLVQSKNIQWFEWYCFASPQISYNYLNTKAKFPTYILPDISVDMIPASWNSFDSVGFDKILWSYPKQVTRASGRVLICNGIHVPVNSFTDFVELGIITQTPRLNIFDSNGFLPLSLNRNELTAQLPFGKDLLNDIYKDLIAYILTYKNVSVVKDDKITVKSDFLEYPGFNKEYDYPHDYGLMTYFKYYSRIAKYLLVSKNGYILNYSFFLKKIGTIRSILIQSDHLKKDLLLDLHDRYSRISRCGINSIPDYKNAIECQNFGAHSREERSAMIFLKTTQYNYLFDKKMKRISDSLRRSCYKTEKKDTTWTALTLYDFEDSIITDAFLQGNEDLNFIREYTISTKYGGDDKLSALFEKYLGDDVVIPFSLKDRKVKFPLAFKELEKYMAKYI